MCWYFDGQKSKQRRPRRRCVGIPEVAPRRRAQASLYSGESAVTASGALWLANCVISVVYAEQVEGGPGGSRCFPLVVR